jgi:predicted nucleic acid-binding protein
VYIDTSVFGGCFEGHFERPSLALFELVTRRRVVALISQLVLDELTDAPEHVRSVLDSLPLRSVEHVPSSEQVGVLRDAYMDAGILPARPRNDAVHVACASVARADALASWNFKDLVRFDRTRAFSAINVLRGYGFVPILSPQGIQVEDA